MHKGINLLLQPKQRKKVDCQSGVFWALVNWHDKAIGRENLIPFIMQRLKVTLASMSAR